MKFTGDFGKIKSWEKRLERASVSARTIVSQQLAEEALGLVREGFETSRDPYGDPWAPLVVRSGIPLKDRGQLLASWNVRRADAVGFSIGAKKPAIFHQRGTGIYGPYKTPIKAKKAKALAFKGPGGMIFRKSVKGSPKRRMVPDRGNLPGGWRRRFIETTMETLTELCGG